MLQIRNISDRWNIELQLAEKTNPKKFERLFFAEDALNFTQLYPTKGSRHTQSEPPLPERFRLLYRDIHNSRCFAQCPDTPAQR